MITITIMLDISIPYRYTHIYHVYICISYNIIIMYIYIYMKSYFYIGNWMESSTHLQHAKRGPRLTCGFCQEITETDTLLSIGAQGTVLSWAAVFFVMSVMGWFGDVVYPLVN